MRRPLFIYILMLLGLCTQAFGQINFHVLDVKSGMSDNCVQDILHDQSGFMWFATGDGLNCYDGYHFRNYTLPHTAPSTNSIEWVDEDASGTIWIQTSTQYCFYNREQDKLDLAIQSPLTSLGVVGTPSKLFVDADSNLWCLINNVLYYYSFQDKKLLHVDVPCNVRILDLVCRDAYAYLLLSDGHVVSVDWNQNAIQPLFQTTLYPAVRSHLYLDTSRHLWLYTSHSSRLQCYSIAQKQWLPLVKGRDLLNHHTMITTVTDDGKGNIWIGTDNSGIFICHQGQRTITPLYQKADQMYSLPSNHITCILKDRKNIMWVGTGKQGVAYAHLDNLVFRNTRCPHQEDVSCLLEDKSGHLWLGFDGEGIARYDAQTHQYTYFNTSNASIPSDLIVCTFRDSKDRIWWGSFGGGAFYMQQGHFVELHDTPQGTHQALPRYIRRITEDATGNIWLATYAQGLYCLSADGTLQVYTVDNTPLLTNYIADLSCVDGHTLYIATSAGVYSLDTITRVLAPLKGTSATQDIIQDGFANCIYQDTRGLLWIGGRKGVSIYNIDTHAVTHLSSASGLSNPYIRGLIEDAEGNMWMATDHGITHVVVVDRTPSHQLAYYCYPYFEEDGIGSFSFNNFSIYRNTHNDILVGGAGGYLQIPSKSSYLYQHNRHVMFTGLYVANERVHVGVPTAEHRIILDKNIQLMHHIDMPYSDRNFALEVSAMDYGHLHKIHYLYRLSNSGQWIKLEGNRIYFNNLAPGTYPLQVKVEENHTNERNAIATLQITVHPPFWLSIPAYILYATLVLALIILAIFRIQRNHVRTLQQQKRDMDAAQQHEIDEAKLRFFTNVSHDLRTPLSLIITPLEKMLHADLAPSQHKDLQLMHRNAQLLLENINQLLDLRALENHQAQLSLAHGDLVEFIQEVCTSFESYADKKNIPFQITLKVASLEMDFDRKKMQRILFNLLSNAFKYTAPQGHVLVVVDSITHRDLRYARIQVIDNGEGIRDENKTKIFDRFFQEEKATTAYVGSGIGLHIVKEYVTLHHGEIQVKDNLPQGTIFEVTLPIQHQVEVTHPDTAVAPLPLEEDSEEVTLHPQKAQQKTTILVVEDNDDFRCFMVDSLREQFDVYEARNGQEGLDMLAHQDVHIIISDIRMPVMDGLELCHRVKNDIRYSHIPVILLTARTADEHVLEGLREGADEYISKPFNLDILLLRIHHLLAWSIKNHQQFGKTDLSPHDLTISSLDEQLITRAMQVVQDHLSEATFTVENLSTEVGMSRGHLYKKLMLITGKSPLEFMRSLRIQRGKQLLDQTPESISQIAYQVGLSPKQFAKYFKEEFGCLPSEYLKNKQP